MTKNAATGARSGTSAQSPIDTFVRAPLVTVGTSATLRAAARAMHLHDVGAVAVVDGDTPDGILSERDVARAIAAGADPDAALVGAWTSSPPLRVHPDASVAEAAIAMLRRQLRCLPAFGEHDERIGFVRLDELLVPMLQAEEPPEHRLPYMPPD